MKGLILYTSGVLCNVEWCIRQLSCPSTILYDITSIAYDHHTDIYPLLKTNIHFAMIRALVSATPAEYVVMFRVLAIPLFYCCHVPFYYYCALGSPGLLLSCSIITISLRMTIILTSLHISVFLSFNISTSTMIQYNTYI